MSRFQVNSLEDNPAVQRQTAIENHATQIAIASDTVIPGLLQTEAYARAVIHQSGIIELDDDEVERRVATRMRRQKEILRPDSPLRECQIILGEAAICRTIGSRAIMAQQLRKMADTITNDPRVDLHIYPFEAGAYPALSGLFVVCNRSHEPSLYVESNGSAAFEQGLSGIVAARQFDAMLNGGVISSEESLEIIGLAAQDLNP